MVMEWKVATPMRSVQIIKALQCDPSGTWVAAGFSSGKEAGTELNRANILLPIIGKYR